MKADFVTDDDRRPDTGFASQSGIVFSTGSTRSLRYRSMSQSLASILALLLFVALTVFCVTRHGPAIVEGLASRSSGTLAEAGVDWANVRFSGRTATMTGTAPSSAERERAVTLVSSVRGVRKIVDRLEIRPPVFEFAVDRRGSQVVLSGSIPDDGSKPELLSRAAALFGTDAIVDELRESGPTPDADWVPMARRGMDLLVQLDSGSVRLRNRDVTLTGIARSAREQQRISFELLEELPRGYTSTIGIDVPEQGQLEPAACAATIRDLMQGGGINFEVDSDRLLPDSSPLLNEIVAVLMRCQETRIEVAGHTDSMGEAALNLTLSRQRALRVTQYLIGRGVDARRLTVRGFGESRPVATNGTPRGRAMNRRIEFNIDGQ